MSSRNWTAKQQEVIDMRGKNILVSASAGSGKTAVLVERIIKRIIGSKTEEPVDIDRFLIVTFTNAAAAEMRERIGKALEEMAEQYPENLHLQRQLSLIHHAQITTIHSFCQYVIRNYFQLVDLDPSFRIADEIENTLLRGEAMEELLEAKYEEKEEGFLSFVESYASGKNDVVLEEMIRKAYEFSMSYPFPEDWLNGLCEPYTCQSEEEFQNLPLIKWLCKQVYLQAMDLKNIIESAIKVAEEPDGPYMYASALESDLAVFAGLREDMTYQELYERFSKVNFARLSSKKDDSVSDAKKNQVKLLRDQVKKGIDSIIKNYFTEEEEVARVRMGECASQVKVFADLILEFHKRFSQKKREKNIVDFHDLEHIALQILIEKEDNGKPVATSAARELQEHYEEIFIDEYQDSNLVQEYLLSSVSKGKNLFMVGDVKQSIYRFRMARPELFMEKYDAFPTDDSDDNNIRIDLHKNFRSRNEVLDGTNHIFHKIMKKDMGNVEYDKEAELQCGASYPDKACSFATEWLFVEGDFDKEQIHPYEDISGRELEARAVAAEIKKLVADPVRDVSYGDIVILLRSMTGYREVFEEVLLTEGIPVSAGSSEGYFSALEVQVVLSYLDLIDNPRQDIPMAVVLKSPIVGLSVEELAQIKARHKDSSLYEAVLAENTHEKLAPFLEKLESFRKRVPFTSIHELIEQVYEETYYYYFASAMPDGTVRKENLDMLLQKAIAYEKTSYSSLFHFLRYIERMKKYEIEFAQEAEEASDNKVRIMTIHKSKGLEFPYVFVCGMGKQFNKQDIKQSFVLDMDMGIGVEYRNPKLRVKSSTLYKKVLQKKVESDGLGEELRVLYVAFTRAKEKLYISGVVKKFYEKIVNGLETTSGEVSFLQRSMAQTYMDWFLPALCHHSAMAEFLQEAGAIPKQMEETPDFTIRYLTAEEILAFAGNEDGIVQAKMTHLKGRAQLEGLLSQEKTEELDTRFSYRYAYEDSLGLPAKVSVSELKRAAYEQVEDEESAGYEVFEKSGTKTEETKKELQEIVPAFLKKEEKKLGGTDRGNAYHHVMEKINFSLKTKEEIEEWLTALTASGWLKLEEKACVSISKLKWFLGSHLAKRMETAQEEKRLYREQPFVYELSADVISDSRTEETILIQGIMDAYFEEKDGMVLLDYKTDYVENEDILIKKYEKQLRYYAEALEALTERPVKECWLYSFHLGKAILVKLPGR